MFLVAWKIGSKFTSGIDKENCMYSSLLKL